MNSRFCLLSVLSISLLGAASAAAQGTTPADTLAAAPLADTLATAAPIQPAEPTQTQTSSTPLSERLYYGGGITFTVGSTTRIGVFPSVAYKFTPKLSLGVGLSYEYISYGGGNSGSTYGVSTFGRYRILPQIYAHGEYRVSSYEVFNFAGDSERVTVPFLLVGGGYSKRLSPRSWGYVEVLFDVLNDHNSPYEQGEPVVSVGMSVGF